VAIKKEMAEERQSRNEEDSPLRKEAIKKNKAASKEERFK
jgi:hypothetical protein